MPKLAVKLAHAFLFTFLLPAQIIQAATLQQPSAPSLSPNVPTPSMRPPAAPALPSDYKTLLSTQPEWNPSPKLLIGAIARKDDQMFAQLFKRHKDMAPYNTMHQRIQTDKILEELILVSLAVQNRSALQIMIQVYGNDGHVVTDKAVATYALLGQGNRVKTLLQNTPDHFKHLTWTSAVYGALQGGHEELSRSLLQDRQMAAQVRPNEVYFFLDLALTSNSLGLFTSILDLFNFQNPQYIGKLLHSAELFGRRDVLQLLQNRFGQGGRSASRFPSRKPFIQGQNPYSPRSYGGDSNESPMAPSYNRSSYGAPGGYRSSVTSAYPSPRSYR